MIKADLCLLVVVEFIQICSIFPAVGNLLPPAPHLKEDESAKLSS